VEIFYEEEDELKRKMLRNTLKNIEYQLNYLPGFLRSHRTSIVNIDHAEDLKRKYNSYYLDLHKIDEPVPVSRQYLVRIKEALQ
jgi:DNA-binding LytR/AlgR family response regulator